MKYIKIADVILFIVLLILVFAITNANKNVDKTIIVINTSDKSYRYTLENNQILEIDGLHGKSIIEIKNRQVCFLSSPCPDKLCIKDGMLKNKPLICMVNAVIIRYDSPKKNIDSEVDSVGY